MLLPGYGFSAAMFFPIIDSLVEYFDLVLVDLPGMGASSRPTDFSSSFDALDCNNYFIDYLEKWRIAMSEPMQQLNGVDNGCERDQAYEFKDFILAGHDMGGYLAGAYTLKKG